MTRLRITGPLSLLLTGIAVIILLLAASDRGTSAVGRAAPEVARQQDTAYPYPAYPSPDDTTATVTPTGTLGTATPTTGTPLPDEGATAIPTFAVATATRAPTIERASPTLAATPTPTGEFECLPGIPLAIDGAGPPHAGYLVYFDGRAVGGGTVEGDGTFRAQLVVGQERAGVYDVTVQVRGSDQVLRELTCAVPATTPTPLPGAGERP